MSVAAAVGSSTGKKRRIELGFPPIFPPIPSPSDLRSPTASLNLCDGAVAVQPPATQSPAAGNHSRSTLLPPLNSGTLVNPNPAMEDILVQCVQNSTRNFMYNNAIFVCERLCAEFPSEINLQLLAGCYLHNNQAYAAYHILKGTQMAQSRYLFALSCFQMDLLREAESALCSANEPNAEVPNGAAGHYLLGLIYRYTDRSKNAVHHFKHALLMDPLLWSAYEELCILGHAEPANEVFSEAAASCIQKQQITCGLTSLPLQTSSEECFLESARSSTQEEVNSRKLNNILCNNQRDIPGTYLGPITSGGASVQPMNGGPSNLSFCNTPSPATAQLSIGAPPPLFRNIQANPTAISAEASPRSTVNSTIQAPRRKFVDEGKLRKISGRLFSDSGPRRSSRLAGDTGSNTNTSTTVSGANGNSYSSKNFGTAKLSSVTFRSTANRKAQSWSTENLEAIDESRANSALATSYLSRSADPRLLEQGVLSVVGPPTYCVKLSNGIQEILRLFRILGEAYRLSCMYKCQDALDVYLKLSQKQYNTAWVLAQVGKAYFELVDYLEADRAFSLARRAATYSLEGMDIYSTVLYHLKEDMKLSYLAQELVATDRLAPQSWCALGNCFSLQKDHETALKNFQRAVQLNSRFAYAHTLCGHEYAALEDYENGMNCYQGALQIDARHYNSWHGLGMIYLRQERFNFAEHHFRMAWRINPHSSVIMTYLGTALHTLKRTAEALEMMDMAILADKKNPLPMYQKASILVSLENFDEALELLEELVEQIPCESSVYALMGRIYKHKNMHDQSMLHFGLALDLKPSAADVSTIKAAMEKLHVPDELQQYV